MIVWKKEDFLVAQEQKLGARGHRADRTLACMFMVARENPWVSALDNSLV